jgi:uncharacterized protein YbaP (TraB family)
VYLARQPVLACLTLVVATLWLLAARAADDHLDRGLLFAVGSDEASPCYLFGTIHSADGRVLALPPEVAAAFDSSETFVLETIPDAQAIIHAMVTMVYTDGRTLASVVGEELYAETVKAMAALGMAEEAFKDFKPWAVVTLLSVPPGGDEEFLDLYLYRSAVAQGKEVFGLESIDEQLEVFEELTTDEQVSLLRETLATRADLPEVFERLVLAYLARDLSELLRLSDEYLAGGDAALAERFHTAAIEVRNRRMAERMQPYLEAGGCFVAVGALHLPGKGGVLERLKGAGHSLRRVY